MRHLRLHLGCGKREIPDFTNVDLCDFPHIHFKSSIDKLPMFQDESVELIYSSHAFEYFDRTEAIKSLQEWNRVLIKGGTLRLAVPDFDKLITVYQLTGKIEAILGPLYGRISIDTSEGEKLLYHKTAYNFFSLKSLLEENGFENVRTYDWRLTIHKDYDDHSQAYYPHMDKDNGILVSLNIEADKF